MNNSSIKTFIVLITKYKNMPVLSRREEVNRDNFAQYSRERERRLARLRKRKQKPNQEEQSRKELQMKSWEHNLNTTLKTVRRNNNQLEQDLESVRELEKERVDYERKIATLKKNNRLEREIAEGRFRDLRDNLVRKHNDILTAKQEEMNQLITERDKLISDRDILVQQDVVDTEEWNARTEQFYKTIQRLDDDVTDLQLEITNAEHEYLKNYKKLREELQNNNERYELRITTLQKKLNDKEQTINLRSVEIARLELENQNLFDRNEKLRELFNRKSDLVQNMLMKEKSFVKTINDLQRENIKDKDWKNLYNTLQQQRAKERRDTEPPRKPYVKPTKEDQALMDLLGTKLSANFVKNKWSK